MTQFSSSTLYGNQCVSLLLFIICCWLGGAPLDRHREDPHSIDHPSHLLSLLALWVLKPKLDEGNFSQRRLVLDLDRLLQVHMLPLQRLKLAESAGT